MAPKKPSTQVLDSYQVLVSAFCEFLTVAIHTILYERDIYPRASFLNARKYNCPVRQNRHPQVCKWIQDAVAAVEGELLKGTVQQTSLVIYSPNSIPLERFIFSTTNFPRVPPTEIHTIFEPPLPASPASSPPLEPQTSTKAAPDAPARSSPPSEEPPTVKIPIPKPQTPMIDLTAQFPPVFTRLSTLSSTLSPLPPDCSFTLAIELRETPPGAHQAPIGWPQPWVPAEPGLQHRGPSSDAASGAQSTDFGKSSTDPESLTQTTAKKRAGMSEDRNDEGTGNAEDPNKPYESQRGKYLGGVKTTPVRSVEAGPFVMEMWVEEGVGKADAVKAAKEQMSSAETR